MTFTESVSEKDRLLNDDSGFALTIDPVAFPIFRGPRLTLRTAASTQHLCSITFSGCRRKRGYAGCGGQAEPIYRTSSILSEIGAQA